MGIKAIDRSRSGVVSQRLSVTDEVQSNSLEQEWSQEAIGSVTDADHANSWEQERSCESTLVGNICGSSQ